jgi:hypothetical protein
VTGEGRKALPLSFRVEAMELPTSIENCHRMIRELVEENAVLRKSGNDFGHLAERLNAALREERRFSEHLARNSARTSRKPRPSLIEDGGGRWSTVAAGVQTYAASPGPLQGRGVRMPMREVRTRPAKWVI